MDKETELMFPMLRLMCDTMPDMLWAKDLNKRYLFVNQAICDNLLFAKNTGEPIGKTDMYFVERERALHPDNSEWHTFGELCQDSDDVTIQANKPMQFDEFGNVQGEFLFLDVRKAPLRDENGCIIGVVGSARDITREKRVELERRILSQAVDQAAESIIITDKQGTIEYVNPAFTKISGFTAEEALGANPRILKSGNQTAEYYERLWATITAGKVWQSALVDRRKDGSLYPALMSVAPIYDDEKNISHYVGIQQDMTENKLLEKKFRQAQKMESLGVLVSGIAHDFNNMLSGIIGNVYLAKRKVSSIPDAVTKIENIETLSYRAADMIKQLMTYARQGAIEKKPFDIISFANEVSKLIDPTMPKHINYEKQFYSERLIVKGDATQVQQVLMNLLNNARDAVMKKSDPHIVFSIDSYSTDTPFKRKYPEFIAEQLVHIIVKDNGHGISEEDQKRIFDPFFTTKEIGVGTGLGLSMVLGSIQEHGGIIEVDSEVDKGTQFNIFLPVYHDPVSVSVAEDDYVTVNGNGEVILLVEDNSEWLDVGAEILESIGYTVMKATTGLEALELYEINMTDISLVLMDVVMPRAGGVITANKMREINPDVRIIFTSGYTQDESLKAMMPSKDEVLLSKPCSVGHCSQVINEILNG